MRLPLLLLFICALPLGTAFAKTELIQSVPAETQLAVPGIPDTVPAWTEMFQSAKKSIDLGEFYLYTKGSQVLEPVVRALETAGSRGVRIRILVSPALSKEDPAALARVRKIPHTELRFLNLSKLTHGILHAKYFVVDGQDAFLGSQNFDWKAMTEIHETGVRTQTPAVVSDLSRIFESDWELAGSGKPVPNAGTDALRKNIELPEQLVASPEALNPPHIEPAIHALVELIGRARSLLRIVVMSYSLDDHYDPKFKAVKGKPHKWREIDSALRAAAHRGVRVQLMVSDWSVGSPEIIDLKNLAKVPNVQVRIVSIPDRKSGYIPYARVVHSKFMLVDDKILWVGTSNWERNYFYGSRNVELILRDGDLAKQGDRIYSSLWTSPYASPVDLTRKYVPRKKD